MPGEKLPANRQVDFITRTRVAQEQQSSGLHIFVSFSQLSSTCHVSFFAAPDTDHKHKFSLTHFTHFSYLSDGLTFVHEPYDSRPIFTLRCSTAEWRINTNPISNPKCWEQLESCRGPNRCPIRRYHCTNGHTPLGTHLTKSLRRERSFLLSIWLFSADSGKKHKVNFEEQEKHRRSYQPARTLREPISTTSTQRNGYQQEENCLRYFQSGGCHVQSNQQDSSVPMCGIDKIDVEKFPNSNSFVIWKMNFKSEVCSNSCFPTEAMLWIKEIDSARSMDELKSSGSILGRILPDFKVPYSKKRVLARSCWPRTEIDSWKDDKFLHDPWQPQDYWKRRSSCWVQVENDTKWDEVLLSMTEVPAEDMLELLCKRISPIVPHNGNLSWSCICTIHSREEKRPVVPDWKKWSAVTSSRK